MSDLAARADLLEAGGLRANRDVNRQAEHIEQSVGPPAKIKMKERCSNYAGRV